MRFRVVERSGLFYPQRRVLWIWWGMVCNVTVSFGGQSWDWHTNTLDSAQAVISAGQTTPVKEPEKMVWQVLPSLEEVMRQIHADGKTDEEVAQEELDIEFPGME